MNKIQILFCLALFSFFKPSYGQGKIQIYSDPSIDEQENERINRRKAIDGKVRGYRIMVGFYNSRTAANEKLTEVRNQFGQRYSSVILYEEPNFKVYLGEFTSKSEAEGALADIRKKYPGARIVDDLITPPKFH